MLSDAWWIVLVLAFMSLSACVASPRGSAASTRSVQQAEIAAAMEHYQVAARSTDPDKIAAFYTSTGVLLEPGIPPIVGSQAIRKFIASFPGVRVDVATATPELIEVWDGKAVLWGSFFERLAFPGQPVSEQHGKFVTQWERQADGSWLIERFYRIPITTQEFPPSP